MDVTFALWSTETTGKIMHESTDCMPVIFSSKLESTGEFLKFVSGLMALWFLIVWESKQIIYNNFTIKNMQINKKYI